MIDRLADSIRVRAHRTELDQLPLGSSRMGGMPDLPPGFKWPDWQPLPPIDLRTGKRPKGRLPARPLHFVAQLNLADIAHLSPARVLPSAGWLCFFYDIETMPWGFDPADRGGWRVCYVDTPVQALVRTSRPDDDGAYPTEPCRLEFSEEISLPGEADRTPDEPLEKALERGEAVDDLMDKLYGQSMSTEGLHRILGRAQDIQSPMELECQLASNGLYCGNSSGYEDPRAKSLAEGAADWRLLFQIDTDEDNPGWMWGDCGRIFYWIREQDLLDRDFDATWLILQCY